MKEASSITHISAYSATTPTICLNSTIDNSQIYRETLEDRINQWKKWMRGRDFEGQLVIMGRPIMAWMFWVIFHIIFYVCLLGMFTVFMALFYWFLNWNFPKLQPPNSILQTPGMGFRPQPRLDSSLVRFIKGDISTYYEHIDHIDSWMRYYENYNQQGENFMDCEVISARRTQDFDKVCRFDLLDLGPDCVKQQNYGFDDGMPCVLIKVNKLFGWEPEEYDNDTVPDEVRDSWSQWWLTVTCFGETPADQDNVGDITIWPHLGFHYKYFPFRNQQGYRPPLVFVRFENPLPGFLLMITCKIWAKNVAHDSNEMSGMVHFELMVD